MKIPDINKVNKDGKQGAAILTIDKHNSKRIDQVQEKYQKEISTDKRSNDRLIKHCKILAYLLKKPFENMVRDELNEVWETYLKSDYSAAEISKFRCSMNFLFTALKNTKENDTELKRNDDDEPDLEKMNAFRFSREFKKKIKADRELKIPKKTLNWEDVVKLIELCINNRDKFYLALSWDTGARPKELMSLKWSDITSEGTKKHVIIKTAKGSGDYSERINVLYNSLPYYNRWKTEYKERFKIKNDKDLKDFIFPNFWRGSHAKPDKSFTAGTLAKWFTDLREKSGILDLHPYSFRHSRISDLQRKGMNNSIIKKMVGHAQKYNVIEEYSHHNPDEVERAVMQAEGLAKEDEKPKADPIIICLRCQKENKPRSKFCEFCDFPLDEKELIKQHNEGEQSQKAMNEILKRLELIELAQRRNVKKLA